MKSERNLGRAATPAVTVVRAVLTACALMLLTTAAFAGSYLDRSQLVVEQASRESHYLQYRLSDHELARLIHRMATARVEAARTMQVPKEVRQAHPHLLLMLENYERAADAAEEGEAQRFIVYQRRARDEEQIFRGVLRQLGYPLAE